MALEDRGAEAGGQVPDPNRPVIDSPRSACDRRRSTPPSSTSPVWPSRVRIKAGLGSFGDGWSRRNHGAVGPTPVASSARTSARTGLSSGSAWAIGSRRLGIRADPVTLTLDEPPVGEEAIEQAASCPSRTRRPARTGPGRRGSRGSGRGGSGPSNGGSWQDSGNVAPPRSRQSRSAQGRLEVFEAGETLGRPLQEGVVPGQRQVPHHVG